jgi:cytochrome c-type biogenesis protein
VDAGVALIQDGLDTWWGPALAFGAGVVSFASPCVLPLVPAYLSLVSGTAGIERSEVRVRVAPMILFVAGFSVVFTGLGAFAGTLVPLVQYRAGLRLIGLVVAILGALMVLYALQVRWPGLWSTVLNPLLRLGNRTLPPL